MNELQQEEYAVALDEMARETPNHAEQAADEAKAWTSAYAFIKDYGNDHYEVLVWNRGTVLNHFETRLDENGETRTYPHWLKSRTGKRITREDLAAENFTEQAVMYNALSLEIKPR